MLRLFFAAFFSLIIFSSCHFISDRVHGSGNVVTKSRDFSNFTGVSVSAALSLYVKQDSSYSVKVEVDDNLQEYIEINQSNGILYIRQRNNTSLDATSDRIRIYVTGPEFKYLEASGASTITGENALSGSSGIEIQLSGASNAQLELKTPVVKVDVNGASSITLRGETKDFSAGGSGSSEIKGFDLLSENATVDVSGASRAEVFGSVKINASASGASHVRCKGKGELTKDESGASDISKID
ncbi:MAG TPA: head GIN domain-containing protein [Chitinophagaceae bacterium]|nr:head GIN domain-containing protein [Chitinophagaceae bacterium]